MIESFVDLTYRGLALGRRVKLAQVRPTTGYLEVPTPMPVGTTIAIVTDDGMTIEACVVAIQEQVAAATSASGGTVAPPSALPGAGVPLAAPSRASGPTPIGAGTARTPGMLIAPTLDDAPAQAWWAAHVGLPELEEAATTPPIASLARARRPTVRPRTTTIPEPMRGPEAFTETAVGPPPTPGPTTPRTVTLPHGSVVGSAPSPRRAGFEAELAAAATVVGSAPVQVSAAPSIPELIDDGKRTTVMDAIDPELLASLLDEPSGAGERGPIDDGKRTIAMAAVDPAALGLLDSAPDADGDDPSGPVGDGEQSVKTTGGSVKRRRKKR